MTAGYKWRPMRRTERNAPREEVIQAWMRDYKTDRANALKLMAREMAKAELWANDLYQVEVRKIENAWTWLCIRRRDGYIGRDWRHFQQIKNEIVGPECEGVELYPAESRLTDTSNKFHIFCSCDPAFRFPFGFETRDVQFGESEVPGLRQRPPMKGVD